jgi:antitoxin (DNA-binding transcriptional repressor) of toxin-antitoxin stability system
MKNETLSATDASRNFSDLINKTVYMKQTTTLLRGGQPVAKVIPVTKESVTGEELAKLWEGEPRISDENGEDWLNLTNEIRSELKLPDSKWD